MDRAVRVVLDAHDADRLLLALYRGCRPLRVHTLVCACGAIGDLRVSDNAWNSWQIFPHPLCPACRALEQLPEILETPELARERYQILVDQLIDRR